MPVGKDEFRHALGSFASGVTVVTVKSGSERLGITVSAFSSVSLEPPLVLICISTNAAIHDSIRNEKRFAVNILSAEQEHLSRQFASRGIDRFEGARTSFDTRSAASRAALP